MSKNSKWWVKPVWRGTLRIAEFGTAGVEGVNKCYFDSFPSFSHLIQFMSKRSCGSLFFVYIVAFNN